MTGDGPRPPYPPPGHFLRHLRLTLDATLADEVVATMPVLPDLCDAGGAVRLGPVAAFVDFAAGGLAAAAAAPDWIVTHDLEIHLLGEATGGLLTARCRHLRQARNHFVSESQVSDEAGRPVAHVFITYTRLHGVGEERPRRAGPEGPRSLADADEAPRVPIDEFLGFEVDLASSSLRFEHRAVLRNSTGAIQGGAIVTAFESLATAMAAHRTGVPARTVSLHLYYLNQGRRPPFVAQARVLRSGPAEVFVRSELAEEDGAGRVLAVGTASAVRI